MRFRFYLIEFLLVLSLVMSLSPPAAADDNEIFGVVTQTVEPNVLIVFDTSGSMKAVVPESTFGDTYDPATDYREFDYMYDYPGTVRNDRIYVLRDKDGDNEWDYDELGPPVEIFGSYQWYTFETDDFASTTAENIRYSLEGSGWYKDYIEISFNEFKDHQEALENGGWVSIDGNKFALGNWINWHKNRNEAAISAIQNIIENHGDSLRFGVMRFDDTGEYTDDEGYSDFDGGFIHKYYDEDNTLTELKCSLKDDFILDSDGNKLTGDAYDAAIANYNSFLTDAIESLPANANTPIAETLAEAGLYFGEKESWFNSGVDYGEDNPEHYPMQYRCRQNYIIVMTDGEPTKDSDPELETGTYINEDTITGDDTLAELDDVAQYLYENDCNNSLVGQQNIVTYTIGFAGGDEASLQKAADKGQGAATGEGLYFPATNQESLEGAFDAFIANINERTTTFSSSVIPISDVNKAYAGDTVYMSLFQPVSGNSRWIGNLKKYKLDANNDFASWDTEEPILDDSGEIKENVRSGWSTSDDGPFIDKGGAGAILSDTEDTERNIYTNFDPTQSLIAPVNEFSTNNENLAGSDFGVDSADRNGVINNIRMVDEDWKLGDLNHSKPAIASYEDSTTPRHILVGSNDGMFHCFNDETGAEAWAFVPKEQFSRLTDVYNGDHSYFLDGSPTVADVSNDEKLIAFGERRGGNHYYVLDISNINAPEHLYTVSTSGQSWQQPQFIRTAVDPSTTEEGFLLSGGYDKGYDDADTLSNPKGNAVFGIDATLPSSELFRFDDNDIPEMSKSIVNARAIDAVDDGEDVISQIYAGDLEGQLFGFRDNNEASSRKDLDGSWQALHVFSAESSGKKIFEQVDTVLEYIDYWNATEEAWETVVGDYVFFGTGDRASPLRTDNTNYFYCVKNDWRTEDLSPSKTAGDFPTLDSSPEDTSNDSKPVMLDVTDNLIQEGTAEQKAEAREQLNAKYNRGWYIELEGEGEKCLSSPTVYAGVVYFTTFAPAGSATSDDPCADPSSGGTAKLYAIDYKTGKAVYNFDESTEGLTKEDRAKPLDQDNITIAPNPTMIISDTGEKLSIGPQTEDVKSPRSGIIQFYWLQNNNQ